MRFLAISGSLRAASVNTALLRGLARASGPLHRVEVWSGLAGLPAFDPDLRDRGLPPPVAAFAARVAAADGLILACPEYIRSLPGALKNALDWLVAGPELTHKPIALIHGSRRGDDMLEDLRRVLETVSSGFAPEVFLRLPLPDRDPEAVLAALAQAEAAAALREYLLRFADHARETRAQVEVEAQVETRAARGGPAP